MYLQIKSNGRSKQQSQVALLKNGEEVAVLLTVTVLLVMHQLVHL